MPWLKATEICKNAEAAKMYYYREDTEPLIK